MVGTETRKPVRRCCKRLTVVFALFAVLGLRSHPARADGAFPDSIGVLLPSDQSNKIIAATNFGLLVSDDNGASWAWVCEEAIGLNAFIYQQGAAPDDLLLAVSLDGLKYSSDFGCTWNRSGGTVSTGYVYDVFPDPVAPLHAYALVRRNSTDGGAPYQQLHDSLDGDQTFGSPLFTSPPGPQERYLSGIENARSRAQRLYLTAYDRTPVHPYLHRSDNDGGTWQQVDLAPLPGSALQGYTVALIAVDPANANLIYLRLIDSVTGRERLGIYDDGVGAVRVSFDLPSPMRAFLRRSSDGALIVASSNGQAFISADQGATFTSLANPPHIRALGERAGIIYAVTDNFLDGYAVARSVDQGVTWQALVRYEQLTGPKHCGNLEATCAVPWQTLQATLRGAQDAGNPDAGPRPANSGCTQGPSNEGMPWSFSIAVPLIVAMGLLAIRRKPRERRTDN